MEEVTSDTVSFQATSNSNDEPKSDFAVDNQSSVSFLQSTPKRGMRQTRRARQAYLTATPVCKSSTDILPDISESPPGAKQVELEYTALLSQLKVSDYIFLSVQFCIFELTVQSASTVAFDDTFSNFQL